MILSQADGRKKNAALTKARAEGALTYISERPCPQGHFERYTRGGCRQCTADRQKQLPRKKRPHRKAYWERYWADPVNKLKHSLRCRLREYVKRGLGTRGKTKEFHKIIGDIGDSQKWQCAHAWCRKKIIVDYTIDHITPLSKGGTNHPHNLQLLCAACNSGKGARDAAKWAQRHGMLL